MKRGNMLKGESHFIKTPSASDEAKEQGLESLAQVARLFNCSTQNLRNWHKHEPRKFQVVLDGCKVLISSNNELKN